MKVNSEEISRPVEESTGEKLLTVESDLYFSRLYFSRPLEITGRILILLTQALMLGSIIIISASLAWILTSKLPIPQILNTFGVSSGVFRGFTIVLATFGIIFLLALTIPTLIARNVKTIRLSGILFLSIGAIFIGLMLFVSIISFMYIKVRYNLAGIILTSISLGLLITGAIFLIVSATYHKWTLSKNLQASYDFKSQLLEGDNDGR